MAKYFYKTVFSRPHYKLNQQEIDTVSKVQTVNSSKCRCAHLDGRPPPNREASRKFPKANQIRSTQLTKVDRNLTNVLVLFNNSLSIVRQLLTGIGVTKRSRCRFWHTHLKLLHRSRWLCSCNPFLEGTPLRRYPFRYCSIELIH